jgi:hypothetical protein
MTVTSVTLYKDINNDFLYGTAVVSLETSLTTYNVGGVAYTNGSFGITPVNLTNGCYFGYEYRPSEIISSKGTSVAKIYVPANVTTFNFGLASIPAISLNSTNLASFSIGGVAATFSLSGETRPVAGLPTTPASPTTAIQSAVGPNPYNYSEHFNRAISALEQISININLIKNAQESSLSTLIVLANDIRNGTVSTGRIADTISRDAIQIKDIYSAVSYSSLLKVLEEDGVDVGALISKTQQTLDNL